MIYVFASNNLENVIDSDEAIFVSDQAVCVLTQETQCSNQDNEVKFWSNGTWTGNSSNLYVAEHIRLMIKDKIKKNFIVD